jgi:hypothetical protein
MSAAEGIKRDINKQALKIFVQSAGFQVTHAGGSERKQTEKCFDEPAKNDEIMKTPTRRIPEGHKRKQSLQLQAFEFGRNLRKH